MATLSTIDSVCLSVRLSRPFKLLLLCFSIESSHFGAVSFHVALDKTAFFHFSFRPTSLLPKICTCTKSPVSRLVRQIDRRCLGLPGRFWGWPRFYGIMQNVVGPTLVAMATNFGLGAEIQSPTGLLFY